MKTYLAYFSTKTYFVYDYLLKSCLNKIYLMFYSKMVGVGGPVLKDVEREQLASYKMAKNL